MTDNEPMSDEQLAEIRRRTTGGSGVYPVGTDMQMVFDRHRLLAEVERLRAREAAAMAIVRDVVAYATLKRYMDDCEWCGQIGQSVDAHASNCPVTKAHALLAE